MTPDYAPLLREWYGTLGEICSVFYKIDKPTSKRALQRAQGLAEVSQHYAKHLGFEAPAVQRYFISSDGANAVEETAAAMQRLTRLYDDSSWVQDAAKTAELHIEQRFLQGLVQRRRALPGMESDMEEQLPRAHFIELIFSVPTEWVSDAIGEPFKNYTRMPAPLASGLLAAYRAGLPSSYVAATLMRTDLAEGTAEHAIRLYLEGIPAELAGELLR